MREKEEDKNYRKEKQINKRENIGFGWRNVVMVMEAATIGETAETRKSNEKAPRGTSKNFFNICLVAFFIVQINQLWFLLLLFFFSLLTKTFPFAFEPSTNNRPPPKTPFLFSFHTNGTIERTITVSKHTISRVKIRRSKKKKKEEGGTEGMKRE